MAVDSKYNEYVSIPLKGVTVRWAKVQPHQFDQFEGGDKKHSIDVLLPKKLGTEMKKAGFLIKEDDDGTLYITPKAKGDKDVGGYRPLEIVNRDKSVCHAEIGNGSVCNVNISAKKWPRIAKISTYIKGIQVLDLVEYSGGGTSFDDESEGEESGSQFT